MEELFLFNFHSVFFLPRLNILLQCIKLLLIIISIIPHLINGKFQLTDSMILKIIIRILFIELFNQFSQFFLFSFDVNVVRLQVFVFLLSQYLIQIFIKAFKSFIYLSLHTIQLLQTFSLDLIC